MRGFVLSHTHLVGIGVAGVVEVVADSSSEQDEKVCVVQMGLEVHQPRQTVHLRQAHFTISITNILMSFTKIKSSNGKCIINTIHC